MLDEDNEGKGDRRDRIILCGEVERAVFGGGRSRVGDGILENESPQTNPDQDKHDEKSEDESDEDESGGVPVSLPPPPQTSNQNPNAPSDSRKDGLVRARNREKVRQAARRGVAFGFLVPADYVAVWNGKGKNERKEAPIEVGRGGREGENEQVDRGRRRKVEAVQGGRVVESSFAKGEWGVRWVE